MSVGTRFNVLATRISGRVSGKHTLLICCIRERRHNTVGCKHNRTVERRKLLTLLPPRVSVVANKMLVLLESRIIVCRKHFAVRIYIHSRSLGLFQQVFDVMQVVSADQNTRILAHPDIHLCNLRIAVTGRICLVEQCHHLDTHLSRLHHLRHPFVGCQSADSNFRQCRLHERMNFPVAIPQTHGMFVISRHTFQTVNKQFFQRTQVLVCLTQYTDRSRFLLERVLFPLPLQLVYSGKCNTPRSSLSLQVITQTDSFLYPA